MAADSTRPARRFRSRDWFDDPHRLDQSALYLERFMNYGITPDELRSGKPIVGIAQTGSDLSPCNQIHLDLARRVRDGIRGAGGIPMEFPVHPIFENCRRPTAALARNLAYLGLVETLYGELVGSGMAISKSRRRLAAGEIDEEEFFEMALASAPSAGHCNTMGTASTTRPSRRAARPGRRSTATRWASSTAAGSSKRAEVPGRRLQDAASQPLTASSRRSLREMPGQRKARGSSW